MRTGVLAEISAGISIWIQVVDDVLGHDLALRGVADALCSGNDVSEELIDGLRPAEDDMADHVG